MSLALAGKFCVGFGIGVVGIYLVLWLVEKYEDSYGPGDDCGPIF